jgi:hypothetical protein
MINRDRFPVTVFPSLSGSSVRLKELSLTELGQMVLTTKADDKFALPLVKLAAFGNLRTDNNSLRHNANVKAISGTEGDYDAKEIAFEEAARRVREARVMALLYTSPSYTVAEPKWRIITPCSRDLPPSERAKLTARVNGVLGGILASESFTLSQGFFCGSVNGNPSPLIELIEGDFVDLRDDLDVTAIGKPQGGSGSSDPEMEDWKVLATAMAIPNDDVDWHEWARIGMAFYRASGGSDLGLEAFELWSAKSQKNNTKNHSPEKQWKHFHRSPPTIIGGGTLVFLAEQADPDWMVKFDLEMQKRIHPLPEEESPSAEQEPDVHADASEQQPQDTAQEKITVVSGLGFKPFVDQPSPVLPACRRHGEPNTAKPVRWMIKPLLPEDGLATLAGQWGTAKTFVALDIAGCVILGGTFIDYPVRRTGGVLFVAAEGAASIGLRFEAMLARKLNLAILEGSTPAQPFSWVDFQPRLLSEGPSDLITMARREAAWMKQTHNVDLALIVIDTIAAAAAFSKENDSAEAQTVEDAMKTLSKQTGALVLGVDHFGKDAETGTRGSSAKEASPDAILALVGKRELTGRITDLRMGVRKVKDGEAGREIPFRLEVINCGVDEDGEQITTCVVHWDLEQQQRGGRPRTSDHGMVLGALGRALGSHGTSIPGPAGASLGVRAAKIDDVRDQFKILLRESQSQPTDMRDEAVKKRWQRARDAALRAGVVGAMTSEGTDYMWEIEVPI